MSDNDGPYVKPESTNVPTTGSVEIIKESYDGPVASVESIKASEQPRSGADTVTSPPPSVDIEKKGISPDNRRELN